MAAKLRGYYWDEKQGIYAYDFRIRGYRFRGSLETADRRKAERNLKDKREEAKVSVSQFTGSEPMTFGVASTRWFNEMASDRSRPDEPARYLRWLQPRVGKSTMIKDIDDNMLARLVMLRKAEKVVAGTINRTVVEPMRAIMFRARDVWNQQVKKIDWSIHLQGEPKERIRELSDSEEEKLFAKLRESYRPIVRFAVLSALRKDELLRMEWEHVDWGAKKLHLIGKGKDIASIPLTKEMEIVLRGEIPAGVTDPSGLVWKYKPDRRYKNRDHEDPRVITLSGLNTEFRRARARAGMKSSRVDPLMGYRFHDNRHTGVTRLVRDSGNLKLGQKLARHSSIQTTMKYAHATEDDLRNAMEAAHSSRETSQSVTAEAETVKEIKRIG